MPTYTVQQGDSTTSVAFERGFFWRTLWYDANNAALRNRRHHPNVLKPGDTLFIPEKRMKEVPAGTEQRHRFRRKGIPEKLRIRLLDESGEPRARLPYILEIDGTSVRGTTDDEGRLEHPIPPNARQGRLTLGEAEDEEHELALGHLDPTDNVSGIQGRLMNMGVLWGSGQPTGEMDDETREALRRFQLEHDLEPTGEIDDATSQLLEESHGS
jgi:N-acetylmuramoyl-L-alanine amidase